MGAVPDHPAIIVIELMDCTLRAALANRRATPNHIHPISMDVAQSLLYLHGIQPHPLIHRDVSAPNFRGKSGTGTGTGIFRVKAGRGTGTRDGDFR